MPNEQSVQRAATTKAFYDFGGGINTEANPADYPTNAAIEALNVDINNNGVVSRRKSLKDEGFEFLPTIVTDRDLSRKTFYWKNAGTNTGTDIIVQQVNYDLVFFEIVGDNAGQNYIGTLAIPAPDPGFGQPPNAPPFSFAVVDGNLIVAGSGAGVYVLEYSSSGSITRTIVQMRIRDFEGVDDGYTVNSRPAGPKTSERDHWYNLRNQGWLDEIIDTYQTAITKMPSNAETWYLGKKETDGSYGSAEAIKTSNFDWGTSPAPRGRQVVGVYNPSQDRQVNNSDIYPTPDGGELTNKGVTLVAGYASRVFYAQSASNISTAKILYSQITDTAYDQEIEEKYGACFQKNDPTSEIFNELLDTDGGVIEIQDMGEVKAMAEIQGSLTVFSDQGVWAISGGAGGGFTATNLSVVKVSSIGVDQGTSVIFTGDEAFFYSNTAIYRVSYDPTSLALSVSDITENTIKTLLREKLEFRPYVYGVFDRISNKALWLAQSSSGGPDIILILNLATGAFTRYEMGNTSSNHLIGIVAVSQGQVPSPEQESLSLYANAVSSDLLGIKMVYSAADVAIGVANFNGTPGGDDVGDTEEGSTASRAELLSGPQTLGDISRGKDILYLTTVFNRTENVFEEIAPDNIVLTNQSGCLGRILWDWTNGADYRVSPQNQLYRLAGVYAAPDTGTNFDYGKGVITTKTKMRGAGKAYSFEFKSDGDKDFQLVGWSVETSAGAAV